MLCQAATHPHRQPLPASGDEGGQLCGTGQRSIASLIDPRMIEMEFRRADVAGYIPFHPNPSKPKYKPPAGAVDSHCHVFGPEAVFPFAPKRKYTPCDAPKEKLFALRDFLGFDKNVIVQATCHDTDNRALVDALVDSNGKAKGVAFVGEEITDARAEGARHGRRQGRALQLHQAAGRLHAEGRDAAHRQPHRQARLAHRGLFRARRTSTRWGRS